MYPLSYDYHAYISKKKQGVVANFSYTYVGPTYINGVVSRIRYQYYFQMNMKVAGIPFLVTISRHIKYGSAGKLDSTIKHFKALVGAYVTRGLKVTIMLRRQSV